MTVSKILEEVQIIYGIKYALHFWSSIQNIIFTFSKQAFNEPLEFCNHS